MKHQFFNIGGKHPNRSKESSESETDSPDSDKKITLEISLKHIRVACQPQLELVRSSSIRLRYASTGGLPAYTGKETFKVYRQPSR